jgi:alpha-L-fucosidase
VEHNFFMETGRKIRSDVNDPQNAALYGPAHKWLVNKDGTPLANDFTYVSQAWTEDWLARAAEIVEKYHPDVMYFDWWIGQPMVRPALTRFAAFYYNTNLQAGNPAGVINFKDYALPEDAGVLDIERGQLGNIRALYWQTDTSVSNRSWGYIENDTFKSPAFIVHQLADIVSKNGNLLLNIGPRADGTIPEPVQQVLRAVGDWLQVNGEAIYGTRPWRVYGEGPTKVIEGSFHDADTRPYTAEDFRFTAKGNTLYAIELGWPAKGEVVIHSLPSGMAGAQKVAAMELVGSDGKLAFQQLADGLHVRVPAQAPGKYAYAFRIHFAESE